MSAVTVMVSNVVKDDKDDDFASSEQNECSCSDDK